MPTSANIHLSDQTFSVATDGYPEVLLSLLAEALNDGVIDVSRLEGAYLSQYDRVRDLCGGDASWAKFSAVAVKSPSYEVRVDEHRRIAIQACWVGSSDLKWDLASLQKMNAGMPLEILNGAVKQLEMHGFMVT